AAKRTCLAFRLGRDDDSDSPRLRSVLAFDMAVDGGLHLGGLGPALGRSHDVASFAACSSCWASAIPSVVNVNRLGQITSSNCTRSARWRRSAMRLVTLCIKAGPLLGLSTGAATNPLPKRCRVWLG